MIWPLVILGALAGVVLAKRKPTSQQRWDDLADSAEDLEHATGRLKYEMNRGTRQSIKNALSDLNLALARAPQHPEEFGRDTFEKFRAKYVSPAGELKERGIEQWADMKALDTKTVAEYRQARANPKPRGLASVADREAI